MIYIELGGNVGDTKLYFDQALKMMEELTGQIKIKSAVYQTEPWGFEAQQPFLNQIIGIQTNLNPEQLLKICLQIETQLGRKRGNLQYISRCIDIDILLFNDMIIELPNLKIPHPKMAERRFVLEPLCEIAPELAHPISGLTIKKMLETCGDKLACNKLIL